MDTYKLICLFVIVSQAAALLTSPPRIVKQPTVEELLFQVAQQGEVDKPFIIECEAEGEPAPKSAINIDQCCEQILRRRASPPQLNLAR
ncbi:Neuroglian [Papilio machaon]|uniref:Neuroglian n=1 Tax=Papilio machaon TaxID=76193 RepID=A0A0N1I7J9_PAPMA|nr:Neuroglian [Papilio machaon]